MYALEYIKNPHSNENYLKLEQYIKNYIQVEKYMNNLQIKYNDIKNYNIKIVINELTDVTLDIIFTYHHLFEFSHEFKCNINTTFNDIDDFILKNSIEFEKTINEYHETSKKDYNDFYLKKKYSHETIDELLERFDIKDLFYRRF